jgi:replicative superfamily II helicase
MDYLYWQNIDRNNFNVFVRDLSQRLNSDVKNIILDTYNDIEKIETKNKKSKKPKKKDIIIMEQTIKRNKKLYIDDTNKINIYKNNIDIHNLYDKIKYLKTDEGILDYKFELLQYVYDMKKFEKIMELYFQLAESTTKNIKQKNVLEKISNKLKDTEYRHYMLKNMGHILPPLNLWDKKEHRLEEWQLKVFDHIKSNESVLVRAPTSSGKSFVGIGAVTFHTKILYVCPIEPVAFQVGSHFTKMGYKIKYLLPNFEYDSYDNTTQIFIGIPSIVEKMIYKIGNTFDFAVFDEIHNLNKKDDGHYYENIIKYINCNFLALSATIKNIENLKDIFTKIHPDNKINLVEYDKRFINQQRWVWSGGNGGNGGNECKGCELKELHPFSQLDDIDESVLEFNLSFTPKDSILLYDSIIKHFEIKYTQPPEDIEEYLDSIGPDVYFENMKDTQILTLDDSKKYETFLKKEFVKLKKDHSDIVKNVLNDLKVDNNSNPDNVLDLLYECKRKDMLPMLIFNTDSNNCVNIFKDIYHRLIGEETRNYPYHYDILEKKNDLYTKYCEKREKFVDNIKISKNSKDPQSDIMNKTQNFDNTERMTYMKNINDYYTSLLEKCKDDKLVYNNLKKEFDDFILNPEFCKVDIFKKHNKYTFVNNEPMSGDKIRSIRKEIYKTLGIKIDYEHILFQMLKRGIGIYVEGMPNEYNWIVQKLLASKEIGIVVSDRSLCLGIDLPIRTSCIMGYKDSIFTNDDYLQMSGRAGRRGYDTKGNIIFYNIDYKNLMRGELPEIIGSDKPIYDNYRCIDNTENMFDNFINDRKIVKCDISNNHKNLAWHLREYGGCKSFIDSFEKIEKNLFMIKNKNEKEYYVLDLVQDKLELSDIKTIYKMNRISDNLDTNITSLREYLEIIMNMYNNLSSGKYKIVREVCKCMYDKIKHILLNHSGINVF